MQATEMCQGMLTRVKIPHAEVKIHEISVYGYIRVYSWLRRTSRIYFLAIWWQERILSRFMKKHFNDLWNFSYNRRWHSTHSKKNHVYYYGIEVISLDLLFPEFHDAIHKGGGLHVVRCYRYLCCYSEHLVIKTMPSMHLQYSLLIIGFFLLERESSWYSLNSSMFTGILIRTFLVIFTCIWTKSSNPESTTREPTRVRTPCKELSCVWILFP